MASTDQDQSRARNQKISLYKNQIKNKLHLNIVHKPDSSTTHQSLRRDQRKRKDSAIIQTQDLFKSKYEILQKIGQGTSAVVYKCRHITSGHLYALKVCNFESEKIYQIKEIFQALVELNHPSIIKFKAFYVCIHTNKVYLVMEDFNFPDLSKYRPKNQLQIKIIAEKLISATEYLHQNGICHRDIKPSNILYDPSNQEIKLIDFNVSKVFQKRKIQKEMLSPTGTQKYRAPETYCGSIYSQIVDEWSVGATLYVLAVHSHPFSFSNSQDRMQSFLKYQQTSKQRLFKEKQWDDYSSQFKDLIQQLLAPAEQRLIAKEALHHMWFVISSGPSSKNNLQRINKIERRNSLSEVVQDSTMALQDKRIEDLLQSCDNTPQLNKDCFSETTKISNMSKKIIKEGLVDSSEKNTFDNDAQSLHYDSDDDNTSLTAKQRSPFNRFKSQYIINEEHEDELKEPNTF